MIKQKILGIIPARGGSKGIKRKNIRFMLGRPLIAYSIIPALKSTMLTDVVVTSEDDEILEISSAYGAPIIKRPHELAEDDVPTVLVLEHAVLTLERKHAVTYDYIISLQPTTPLRTSQDIDLALNKLITTNADSVISVVPTPGVNPEWIKYIIDDKLVDYDSSIKEMSSRHDMAKIYIRNGCIYSVKRDYFLKHLSFKSPVSRPYIMDSQLWANIDTERDWILAEAIMKNMNWNHIPLWKEMKPK